MTSAFITLAAAASLSAQGATPAPTASTPVSGKSTYVDLDGSVGYSTNPNLAFGNATGRAFVRVSARAVHTRFSVRSNTSLSAYGENVTYLGRYGSQQIFSLGAHHDTAISEKVRLFGDLTGSLDRSGLLGTRFGPLNTVDLSAPTIFLPSLPDAQGGFVTAAGRTYSLGAQLGAQIAMSAVDSVTVRGGANHIMLRGTSFDNSYNILLASMAYDRRLNARTSIGEVVSVQSTDYDGPGSVLVITPQATARMSLSDNTDISGAVGVSFATVKNGLVTRRSTGLAFNGSLCHRGESDQLCASVARDQQTSTIAGPVSTLSAGLTYSRRLDAKQTVQLSASGSRYSAQDSGLGPLVVSGNSTYFNGGVAYTRQLGPRLSTGGNLSTRRLFRDGVDPKADVSGSLFLRIRLGDRQ